MHVFITGATGWVGSAVVNELLDAGHLVTGLVRSAEKASTLTGQGMHALVGTLDDHELLQEAAAKADAVIHTAFNHDFSHFAENCEQDRRAIEALGSALKGSDRPLLVTSGLSGLLRGATEAEPPNPASLRQSEAAARALADEGVRAATVRLASSVHGIGDHAFVPILIKLAREHGVSAYPGDGHNVWSGVHRLDAARVYRLALETGVSEPVYHAVADEAVPIKRIAEIIGQHLDLPVVSRDPEHFGWFARMAAGDMAVSSTRTRVCLDWEPTEADLLSDLDQPGYYDH